MTHPAGIPYGTANGGAFGFYRSGYDRATSQDLTTADLESATVYDHDDETIGSIRSLKIGFDGKISDAVIDVGGLLGMGSHAASFPFSQLTVLRARNGSDIRVHLDTTKEKLTPMSFYDK